VPSVVTFHDVTFLRMQTFSRVTTLGMRETIVRPARKADALITGSAAARDEICALLGMDPVRFAVVPHGPGRPIGPVGDAQALARQLELEGRRVAVCVGAKRPHKNQELLVRAARELPEAWVVVLAGHPEPYDAELRELAAAERVADRVRFVDYLPDEELEALWSIAAVAALPTLGEGFGLPVLEAMRRGVPVACSDIPVLREVAGEDARYFDPHDPASAGAAIVAAAGDERLGAAGRERAERFSWRTAAEGTFEAYERAVAR
jgi:glycosyltransferase involved in cell wall biosynthesis